MSRAVFVLLCSVTALVWWYISDSLFVPALRPYQLEIVARIFCAILYFLIVIRFYFFKSENFPNWLASIALWSFGFMSQAIAVTLFKDIGYFVAAFFLPQLLTYEALVLQILISAFFLAHIYGTIKAFRGPRVQKVFFETDKLSSGQQIKVAQISDLHIGPSIGVSYVQKVVSQVKAMKPDLIALTGDIGDGTPIHLQNEIAVLRQLKDIAPVYYIPGNHEFYWNYQSWLRVMESCGFKDLISLGEVFKTSHGASLWVGGMPDPTVKSFDPNLYSAERAISGAPEKMFKLLLTHQPQTCNLAKHAGFDLMICGHTHNGQYFPYNLLVPFFNPYNKGMNDHQGMGVYVNVGTGFWGPPQRLGTTSETTELIIKSNLK